jgi:hypothetical protein
MTDVQIPPLPSLEKDRQVVLLPTLGLLKPYTPRLGKLHSAEERPREHWEAWGFVMLDPTPEHELIGAVPVQLPVGWSLRRTDPGPIATLVDEQNRGRAFLALPAQEIPQASIIAWPRLSILPHFAPTFDTPEPHEGEKRYAQWCYKVIDHFFPEKLADGSLGRLLFSSSAFEASEPDEQRSGYIRAQESCKQWLNERRPDWQNPFAYWTEEHGALNGQYPDRIDT